MTRRGIAGLDDDDLDEELDTGGGDSGAGAIPAQAAETEQVLAQGRPRPALTLADLPDPVETEASGPLTAEEEEILQLCMRGIAQFKDSWWVNAKALANVNGRRLYRKTHATFQEFAREHFGKSSSSAYEEITAYAVGELLSARADTPFESPSNALSARADIGKKAAVALNPITKERGAEVSVAVHETIVDAAGKRVPVRAIKGIVQQIARESDKAPLTDEQLLERARQLAAEDAGAPKVSAGQDQGQGGGEAPALAALRAAVDTLKDVHGAFAPAKVAQAREAAAEDAERLLGEARGWAQKVLDRTDR